MAKGYNHHNHQLTQQAQYSKNSFLPLLCRASINDVKLPDFKDHSFSSFSGDPSSPKVSCIGQIKRKSKLIIPYRLTSSAATTAATTPATIPRKKLYSSKTFTTNAPTVTRVTVYRSGGRSCRSTGGSDTRSYFSSKRSSKIDNEVGNNQPAERGHISVNLKELDPPLPVIIKLPPPSSEENLWNRRKPTSGMALKSLLIQHHINLPSKINNQPDPTV